MAEAEALNWRELMEKHHSALVDEMAMRIDADLRQAVGQATTIACAEGDLRVAEARVETRRAVADSLHQSMRRLRQSSGDVRILKVLNEISAPWAQQSVVLVFENHQARAVAFRGVSVQGAMSHVLTAEAATPNTAAPTDVTAEAATPGVVTPTNVAPDGLVFDITSAPAVVAAIESHDPVVALLSPRELSGPLAEALGVDPGSRAYLCPILVRQSVVAVLVAAGAVSSPHLELLCDAAAMRLEASTPAPVPAPDLNLVHIATAGSAANTPEKLAWEDLSSDQQRLHLQAQRTARVRTAEMRLYQPDALQGGVAAGDIYTALKSQIDAARSEFRDTYLSKSSTMVDYLHLEILRTLAHDDDHLLGAGYPGPLV